ncbi:N-acetylmuramoyl-L-alanine amidase [Archangium violaceum]|uniref:N-acetylmuramoyl-L-alanine amidase n=1 Tax=Archangium violaceum TaxID=83451 RepID=UPI00193B8863|nr:N-acetylmuramoyl-L-alanine amidase [Archangium violaceum]QRK08073.1 N-acetylmuramoyl-L-alanine amidase [Archangium violaceum]
MDTPSPTIPLVIDFSSPNRSAREENVRVDTVLIHHTGNVNGRWSNQSALTWLCTKGSMVSAHYLITTGGIVYRLVPEDLKAWHAGESHMPWEEPKKGESVNDRSIGIEIVNPGDGVTPFTEAQYKALAWLVSDIVRRLEWDCATFMYGVTVDLIPTARGHRGYVLGHRDVAPGRKTDPADNFDWTRIRKDLASQYSGAV